MTCAFKGGRSQCRRDATFVCTLCGDHVCREHSSVEFHFNVRSIA